MLTRYALLVGCAVAVQADSIVYEATGEIQDTSCQINSYTAPSLTVPCTPFIIDLPQFDPAHGTLSSVSYSVYFQENYVRGVNDGSAVLSHQLGQPYTASFTFGVLVPLLNLDLNQTAVEHHIVIGRNVSGSPESGSFFTIAAGTYMGDHSTFVGTGTVSIAFNPYGMDSTDPESLGVVASMFHFDSFADVTITYNAVPEPRWTVLLIGFGFVWLCSRNL
jgi:hypothetical protein